MDVRIKRIIDRWYLTEPALLMTILAHEMVLNTVMSCPFRCGKGTIEYNPKLTDKLTDNQLESGLKAEAIRIILKHPYERQPDGCSRKSMALGSNLVLADNYDFSAIGMAKPSDYALPENESYEWYSMRIEGKGLIPDDTTDTDQNDDSGICADLEGPITILEDDGADISDNESDLSASSAEENDGASATQGLSQGDGSSQGTAQPNDADDFYVLTLADGTTMLISKGSSSDELDKDSPEESEPRRHGTDDDAKDELANDDRENGHPEETRKFESHQKKIGSTRSKQAAPSEELSSLWEEDSMMSCAIDAIIEDIESSGSSWGSLAGKLAERIIANTKAKIDYRKVLSGFRASILSSKRHLTRMRPNRRSGFDNMGSIRRFDTNVLIAVDVSGSISDEVLRHFYSVIGRIFKYGIEHVDVVQFDCSLSEVQSFEKAKKRIDIIGRGGTSFQPIFDYVLKENRYDGLLIFTDGDAPKPPKTKGFKTKVVWICENEKAYERHKAWMKETGRCCTIKL